MAEADNVARGDGALAQTGSPASAPIELGPTPIQSGDAAVQAPLAGGQTSASQADVAEAQDGSQAEPDSELELESSSEAESETQDEPESEPESDAQEEGEAELEAESEEPVRDPKPGALASLKLEKVDADEAYQLRPEGEVDTLATSMARLGQLFPVDLKLKPPDRFQVVCGFRRVSALRLLKRERVLARVHTDLTDEDALRLALADLLEHQGAGREELEALKARLEGEHRLTPPVKDALERAISPVEENLGPEEVQGAEEEVDLDELAQDITRRLAGINQDLALVTELWSAMEPSLRRALLDQLAYPEQLAAYLRGL